MKINLKPGEHVRVKSDAGAGFTVHVENDEIHIRAKAKDEPEAARTTLVLESRVEVAR